ncbi:MAG: hypothetical protein H7Y88_11220 [Phycisphaerales bacterium]|nr:hypothetical protein [Phycisphaerales bacterium]
MPSASSFHSDLSDAASETLAMLRAQIKDEGLPPVERRLAGNAIIRLIAVAARFKDGSGLQTGVARPASTVLNSVGAPGTPPLRGGSPSPASSSSPSTPNSPLASRKGGAGGVPARVPPAPPTINAILNTSAKEEPRFLRHEQTKVSLSITCGNEEPTVPLPTAVLHSTYLNSLHDALDLECAVVHPSSRALPSSIPPLPNDRLLPLQLNLLLALCFAIVRSPPRNPLARHTKPFLIAIAARFAQLQQRRAARSAVRRHRASNRCSPDHPLVSHRGRWRFGPLAIWRSASQPRRALPPRKRKHTYTCRNYLYDW